MERSGLRIRDFELVLHEGILGASTQAEYNRWAMATRARSREFLPRQPGTCRTRSCARSFISWYAYY